MAMTVKELRDALAGYPDDMLVICLKDGEGNGYSPLAGVDGENNSYVADTTWSGEVGLTVLTEADVLIGYEEEDVAEDGIPCLLLYPVS